VVREGTASLLAAQPGIEVVATAGSIDGVRDAIARVAADVFFSTSGSGPTPAWGSSARRRTVRRSSC
jgi:DNA-binding NarL/FixJ family response regulator